MRKFLTALPLAVGVLFLTACGSNAVTPFDIGNDVKVAAIGCDKIHDVTNEVARVAALPEGKEHSQALSAWKIDPTNTKVITDALNKRNDDCQKATVKPGNEPKVETVAANGDRAQLPIVGDNGKVVTGNSTTEADTPPVAPADALQKCGVLAGWDQLVACMGDQQWYIDGVNQMKPYTGFGWDDIVKWANTKNANGKLIDSRTIQVYSLDISDADARNALRGLVGADADKLPIVRHGEFVNSRGLEKGKVNPFVDRKKQVRVSLSPLVFDAQGNVTGLRGDAGVFVDCLNIWGMPLAVASAPGQSAVCPTSNGMTGGQAVCSSPPPAPPVPPSPPTTHVCPPDRPHGVWPTCKDDPSRDPAQQGNAGNGGGRNTGSGIYIPPAQMEQPPAPSHVNPAPPAGAAQPTKPPVVNPPAQPAPQPTVVPSTQPPNNGSVNPSPGAGQPCNPDFQNC